MAKATKKKKTTKKRKKRESKQRVANRLFILKIFAYLVITLACYLAYCFLTLPDIEQAVSRTRQPSTTITAENGNEVATYGQVYSAIVMPDYLPKHMVEAIIATEDRRFYQHFGFDVIAFSRAMVVNLIKGRYAQGGSTITQQVAKNLFLTPNKNIKRKIQELLLAFWLEYKFSKDQIMALYLNRVYLGAGTYGIEAAANKYFQKTSADLNLKESAILAGMLKAPTRYNPAANPDRAEERARVVLQNMVDEGYISEEERQQALKMKTGALISDKVEGGKYFADWVYGDVNAYIGERENDIYVYTTLNQHIQEAADKILTQTLKANKNKNVTQGAIVVLDKTGAIKAMVGGVDYHKSQFNRAINALRQPGSSFKTFVYLCALENGYKPEDKIGDFPISIGDWQPENIDKKYHGEVTLAEALAKSYNLATINLAQSLSSSSIIKIAKKAGITTPIQNSPSLALGTSEVKVIDMAVAYSAIANGGFATWPYAIKEIYSRDGYQLYMRDATEANRIFDEEAVEDMTKMLEAVVNKGTGRKARLPFFAAGKTGTSQDYRDAWFVGFTDKYIAAVWVGNDDNSPMKNVGGSSLPAEIWRKVMLAAHSPKADE